MTIPNKRVAVLSPVAWRTPPRQYGAWETVASNITEGLVSRGWDVTLFASRDSVTRAHLHAVVDRGYEEDPAIDPKVAEYLHISEAFEHAAEFDLIHSHYDFMALSYTRLVKTPVLTTIHGFSSPRIMTVYEKYRDGYFVSISNSDRAPGLNYLATVYNGIDLSLYPLQELGGDHLIFLGRIHPDKGVHLAIEVARLSGFRLGPPAVRYFCTVRGETRIPSFSFNSLAMRSSPQVGFSAAIFRINPWRSLGKRQG
jgi:glycosyltransferase involved in cell wall biosynthesis